MGSLDLDIKITRLMIKILTLTCIARLDQMNIFLPKSLAFLCVTQIVRVRGCEAIDHRDVKSEVQESYRQFSGLEAKINALNACVFSGVTLLPF